MIILILVSVSLGGTREEHGPSTSKEGPVSNVISYVALRTLHRPLVKKKITSTLRRLTCANNAQGKISCHGHDPCACVLTMRGPSAANSLRAQIAKRRCAFMDGHCLEYGSKESRDR